VKEIEPPDSIATPLSIVYALTKGSAIDENISSVINSVFKVFDSTFYLSFVYHILRRISLFW